MSRQSGQSLIEVLVALAIFVLVISVLFALLGNSFLSSRQAQETSQALFLAEEGLEASRSLRDNNWDDLSSGSHGLVIADNHWIFQGTEEDLSSQLNQGKRQIMISDLEPERKLVSSRVWWQISPARNNEVILATVLSHWQKISQPPGTCQGQALACNYFAEPLPCQNQDSCLWSPAFCYSQCTPCPQLSPAVCLNQQGCELKQVGKKLVCRGQCTACGNFIEQTLCQNQLGCLWQPGTCSGTVTPCENFTNQPDCEAQQGCSWVND